MPERPAHDDTVEPWPGGSSEPGGGADPPGEEPTEGKGSDGGSAGPAGSGVWADPAGRPAPDVEELEDRWRRTAADLDNLRKRYARELDRARAAERELVAASFLPVLDNIDRALEHAAADPRSVADGVRAVREQAVAVLAGLGYHRDDAADVPFDPARHEVVGVVEAGDGGGSPGSVATVVRPGYGAPGRQLRPAAVTVTQPRGD